MQITQPNIRKTHYRSIRDFGDLKPFAEQSLFAQVVPALREAKRRTGALVIFSKQDEEQMAILCEQVIGGIELNRGMGHTSRGLPLFLNILFRPEASMEWIPVDGDMKKPLTGDYERFTGLRPAP